jgi:hypothetical protein
MSSLDYVPVTVEAACTAGPDVTFHTIVPIDLTAIFKGWGPLPAVKTVLGGDGTWERPGQERTTKFSDGGTAREVLTEYTAPHSFAYELTSFTNSLAVLVTRIRGEWTFTPDGNGTLVRWTYAFYPRRGRRLLVRCVLAPLWRRYAENVIIRAIDAVPSR